VQVFTEAAKFARTAAAAYSYGSRPGVWGRGYTGSPKQFPLVLIPQNLKDNRWYYTKLVIFCSQRKHLFAISLKHAISQEITTVWKLLIS